jgi:hypothetical protein
MKTIFCTLTAAVMLLLLPSPTVAEDGNITVPGFSSAEADAAQGVGVLGPTEAEPGDEVTLRLTGTPSLDLTKPLIDQLDWLMGDDRMFVYWAVPGKNSVPLDVRGELVFSPSGASMQPLVRVQCKTPGEHRLLVDWNYGQDQLVEHRLMVGGEVLPPVPPPVPPVPPGERKIVVVIESKTQTPEAVATIYGLRQYLDQKEHEYRIADPDLKDASKAPAPWLQPYLVEIRRRQADLPVLIVDLPPIGGVDSSDAVESLPATAAAAVAVVQKHGG